jgi:tRNA 5-methylaminomethyl-2-thiouridine biosynthesis bifunctional protein
MPVAGNTPWFDPPAHKAISSKTAVIIGAGLAGCSAAYHLAELGWSVQVLEQNKTIASATSGNIAGIVKPQANKNNRILNAYFNDYYTYFLSHLQHLLTRGEAIEHDISYALKHLVNDHSAQETVKIMQAGWLNPQDLCSAQLRHKLIKLRTNTHVSRIEQKNNQWLCLNDKGDIEAQSSTLVLANNLDISTFEQSRYLPLAPLAGQVSLLNATSFAKNINKVHIGKHYLIPLPCKNYLIGASHIRTKKLAMSVQGHEDNIAAIKAMMPSCQADISHIIGGHTGIRGVSPDHLPIVGALPDAAFYLNHYDNLHHGKTNSRYPSAQYLDGLYVFGALGSHGIATSPYLGQVLAKCITQQNLNAELSTTQLLHPGRFIIRQLRRKPKDRNFSNELADIAASAHIFPLSPKY